MSKTDYSKTIIYYVYFNESLLYIGHSTNIKCRKNQHHHHCYNTESKKYHLSFYKHIREKNIQWDDLRWECEKYPCADKNEAIKEEGLRIRRDKPIGNIVIPGRTTKEYVEDNKEKIKERFTKYVEDNKIKIQEQKKKYREENKVKISEEKKKYREENKEKIKEKNDIYYAENKNIFKERSAKYYEENKETIKTYQKNYRKDNNDKKKEIDRKYREENQDKIKVKRSELVHCDVCNVEVTRSNYSRHNKSILHQENLNKKPSAKN
jgi:hypothetical protein